MQNCTGQKFKWYKYKDGCAWGTAKEIDSQVNSDADYCKLLREMNTQKYYFNFISETLNTIKNLGFVIKNYLDYKKMESY